VSLLGDVRSIVGETHVRTDPEVNASQVVDWTNRFHGRTPAVIRPGSVSEVAAVVRTCNEHRAALVPQGGNTGLVGGSIPLHDELVLDLRRLDALEPVDPRTGQVTAQAGVTIARLQQHADAAGWHYAIDLASRDTATVGGTIATNAGGVHVFRYGSTRAQVVGVEAVLANGDIIRRLDGLEKDNTGYDLAGLVCGSEGTLAIVTAARLRLVARPAHTVVALLAFATIDDALDAVGELRRRLDCAQALELFLQAGLDLVHRRLGLSSPFAAPHAAYVLVEAAANVDPTDALAAVVQDLRTDDVAVAPDASTARALWRLREAHTEAINLEGAPHKLDVSLPSGSLAAFMHEVPRRIETVAPGADVWLFGHAGDGNVHVNVTGVAPSDERVTRAVLEFVAELHGSISAEHGIGTAKRAYIRLVRSASEIAAYRAIKHALDPVGILSPHVLFPEAGEAGGDGSASSEGGDARSDSGTERSGHPA
jgi:FAD/FMN-containing dehydrogenase